VTWNSKRLVGERKSYYSSKGEGFQDRKNVDLVYQTSLIQTIQPNFRFFHIDGNGSHGSRQLDQSGLGPRWLFDITSPCHAHLDGLATAFGLSGGQGSSILDDFVIDTLIGTPNDHVGAGTSRTATQKRAGREPKCA